jgi:hypothetical protein
MMRLSHDTLINKGQRVQVVRKKARGLSLDHAFPVDETKIHCSIVQWLEAVVPWAEVHHSPNGGKRSEVEAAKFKRMGTRAGRPDIEIGLPEGRTLFLEVKTQAGDLSKDQKDCIGRLKKLGFPVGVVRSIDEARSFLRTHGIETREAA